MGIRDIIDILKLVDPRRKPLQRLGAFLCRERIAALEDDLVSVNARLADVQREANELRAERDADKRRLADQAARLDVRRRFRRVHLAPGVFVCVERVADADDAAAAIACPSCYVRGELSLVFPVTRHGRDSADGRSERIHLKCRREGCGFHVAVSPEAFHEAFKLVD